MEEREQSSHGGNHRSSSTSLPPKPSISHPGNSSESLPAFQISDQSTFGSGKYIVQVPRDQVYRVPPPENATFAERHRRDHRGRANSSCCGSCSLCSFILVIVIVLIGAIVGSVVAIFLIYDNPGFRIEHFLVKRLTPLHHKQSLEYDIKMKVQNPNKYHGVSYDQDDSDATLSLKQKKIAAGKFPNLDQGSKDSTVLNVPMHGSSSQLPKEIATSINRTHSKRRISLSLSVNVPVKLKIGALNVKSKKIEVSCSFLVDRFDKGAQVLTQECTTIG